MICLNRLIAYSIELIFAMTMLGCEIMLLYCYYEGKLNILMFDLVDLLLSTIQSSAIAFDVLSLKTIVRTWVNHVSRQLRVYEVLLNQVEHVSRYVQALLYIESCIRNLYIVLSIFFWMC